MNRFARVASALALNLAAFSGLANAVPTPCLAGYLDGRTLQPVALADALSGAKPGTVVIMSEVHDNEAHHANQREALEALGNRGLLVSTGLEFFEARFQGEVDQYLSGALAEADFLKAIGWGQIPYSLYRDQALFPRDHGGRTLALNASRALTGKVAKTGLESLTDSERALLPPGFTLGNEGYRARFAEAMGDHVPPESLQRYFEAQSVWDETMAATARDFIVKNPEQILFILVGDFHAAFGGGLPDRLRARGQTDLVVISQVLSPEDATPSAQWGARGDFVWAP